VGVNLVEEVLGLLLEGGFLEVLDDLVEELDVEHLQTEVNHLFRELAHLFALVQNAVYERASQELQVRLEQTFDEK